MTRVSFQAIALLTSLASGCLTPPEPKRAAPVESSHARQTSPRFDAVRDAEVVHRLFHSQRYEEVTEHAAEFWRRHCHFPYGSVGEHCEHVLFLAGRAHYLIGQLCTAIVTQTTLLEMADGHEQARRELVKVREQWKAERATSIEVHPVRIRVAVERRDYLRPATLSLSIDDASPIDPTGDRVALGNGCHILEFLGQFKIGERAYPIRTRHVLEVSGPTEATLHITELPGSDEFQVKTRFRLEQH